MRRIILALSFLMFVATAIAVAQSNDDNSVFLPVITANRERVTPETIDRP